MADLSQGAPGSASGLAIQASPRADSAVARTELPEEPWPGVCGDPEAAGWREGQAARRLAHPAGRAELGARRLQHHGQVARSRPAARQAASLPGVMPLSSAPSSWSVHPASSRPASPAPPPPHFIWLRGGPGNVLPRCKEYTAGTGEDSGPGPSKQPAPFPCHLNPGALAPRLLCPTGVSRSRVAPFSSQPTRGRDAGSVGSVQRIASRPPRPTIRLLTRGGRRGERGEGGGGRLGRSTSPPRLLL